ncbi:MAG TPA: PAS domain S-box protein, partial [Chromatiaceae bacterium]|nr:PAS domain S-box protein [Chromatiaceae bacterium]
APLGILLVEARTGRIILANHCFARIVGRTPAELEQLDWMSITHPEDLVANRLGMEQLNAREISTYHAVKRYLRPNGSAVWTNMTTSRVHANGRDQLQNLTMVEDITAQRKAEQKSKSSPPDWRNGSGTAPPPWRPRSPCDAGPNGS